MPDDLFTVSSDYYIPPSSYLPPVNGVCEGYVFTLVCHSVHGVGGGIPACIAGGIPACLAGFQAHTPGEVEGSGQGGSAVRGGCLLQGVWRRPNVTATAAGGAHPTGMYPCIQLQLLKSYSSTGA